MLLSNSMNEVRVSLGEFFDTVSFPLLVFIVAAAIVVGFVFAMCYNFTYGSDVNKIAKKTRAFLKKNNRIDAGNAAAYCKKCARYFDKSTYVLWRSYLNERNEQSKQQFLTSFREQSLKKRNGMIVYQSIAAAAAIVLIFTAFAKSIGAVDLLVDALIPLFMYVAFWIIIAITMQTASGKIKKSKHYLGYVYGFLTDIEREEDVQSETFKKAAAQKSGVDDLAFERCVSETFQQEAPAKEEKVDYLEKIAKQVDDMEYNPPSKGVYLKLLDNLESIYKTSYLSGERQEKLKNIIDKVKIGVFKYE